VVSPFVQIDNVSRRNIHARVVGVETPIRDVGLDPFNTVASDVHAKVHFVAANSLYTFDDVACRH
jgi:hypothetical protein